MDQRLWWILPASAVGLCLLSALWTRLRAPGFDVNDKHVFITGGSQGLGLSLAVKYAKAHARVTIAARSLAKLEVAKAQIEQAAPSAKVFVCSCDVTSFDQVRDAIAKANEFHQRATDHVVCCAGMAKPGYLLEQDVSVYHQMMDLNYFGVVHTVKAALPAMIEANNGGRIIIVSSGCGLLSFIGYSQYCPSKYALRGFAEAIRNEFKLYGIGVHIFYPGNIDSPGFVEENKCKPEETREIEGASTAIAPDQVAQDLINGVAKGHFAISNDPLLFLLRLIGNGVAPRNNTPLELLLLPVMVVVQFGFGVYMDFVVWNSKKTRAKAKKD